MQDNRMTAGAMTVVVSGNRAIDNISADKLRCVGIDGRLSDLDSSTPSHLMPLISDNWEKHFEWRGDGTMPEQERAKLREMIRKAHGVGRMVRFWAAPDNAAVWEELYRAGVDLINTDRLARLDSFLVLKKEELVKR
jgi:glycerophosphoryl diester phosphodiesterase